jgi:hypothetical protein
MMSVLLRDRGLSKMEFYHTARDLREDITNLLLRDFGIKDKVRTEVVENNKKVTIIEEYPEWLISEFRTNIIRILRKLVMNITAGNTMYPLSDFELSVQRQYKTEAIINCEQLLQEIQFVADVLPIKLDKFIPYAERIEKEIALLKGWRKASNKLHQNKGGKEKKR